MKNNNKFHWKQTASGVAAALYIMCNTSFAQETSNSNTFTLNLKNTDIHSLIATVSKQTGRNFVVDPRVKAKVTVISTDPVGADGLYEVFLSVLQVHGYSAVPAGDLIKIVPDVTAKQGPVPILGDNTDSSDQLVTQVIKVINVPAAQLVPILRPMVPQQGHLAAYAATNSLIITDRSSNIQRLSTIIKRIDRPDNEEIEVVRLNHASATDIVGTLTSLQRNNIGGQQGPGAIQLVADERTNSVLISGDQAVRVRIRGLIAHLDTPIESGGNTRVVYLKFANAEDMVSILQGVSQGQAKVGATTETANSNTPTTATQPAQPQQNGQNGATQNPQANANNLATQRQQNAVQARSSSDVGESNVDIQADPNTNALIITAPADEMQNILAVIRQLDIRRAQVLVEAVIAEITEDNTREFGINFLLDGSGDNGPIGFTNLGGATDGALGVAGAVSTGNLPSSLGSGLSLALGRFGSSDIDFGFLVRAIASDADNNILSTPSLMTLDNEEAEIVVGSNVPFVTGTQLSANNDNPFQTIERQDIGLTLKVKPQINEGNTIKMELEQEVSDVSTTAVTGAADIITSRRSIKTTVLVEDGQTLVLGGLIDDSITDVEEKIPLLGDIPVLGRLFRYRSTQKSKQNLLIFLHPVIVRDAETGSRYSSAKYNFLRSQQTLSRQEKDGSIQKDKSSLPEIRMFFDGKDIDNSLTRFDDESPTKSIANLFQDNDDTAEPTEETDPQLPPLSDIEKLTATTPEAVAVTVPSLVTQERQTASEQTTTQQVPDTTIAKAPVEQPVAATPVIEQTVGAEPTASIGNVVSFTESPGSVQAEQPNPISAEQLAFVQTDVLPLQTFPPASLPAFTSKISAPKETVALMQVAEKTLKPALSTSSSQKSSSFIKPGDGSLLNLGNPVPKSIQAAITEDQDSKLIEVGAASVAQAQGGKIHSELAHIPITAAQELPLAKTISIAEQPAVTAEPAEVHENIEASSESAGSEVSILSIVVTSTSAENSTTADGSELQ